MEEDTIRLRLVMLKLRAKFLLPKRVRMKLADKVGPLPYIIPIKMQPAMKAAIIPVLKNSSSSSEPINPQIQDKVMLVEKPDRSKESPVRILPDPLESETMPTIKAAKAASIPWSRTMGPACAISINPAIEQLMTHSIKRWKLLDLIISIAVYS